MSKVHTAPRVSSPAHKVGKAVAVKPIAGGPRPEQSMVNPLLLRGLYWS